jgi:hypothetical protein
MWRRAASVCRTRSPHQGNSVQQLIERLAWLPERDSPRDQLVVTLFLLTVFGLLLGAGIKGRMVKAGLDTSLPWNTGRKWWQVSELDLSTTVAFIDHAATVGIGTRAD